ncbi:MAG: hypothetical protein DRN92_02615 [Thermoproteota archaeon]|nr:MAG: hypothetical protein DRN92_02615 [Candidatus Korarchaeota archaeon]
MPKPTVKIYDSEFVPVKSAKLGNDIPFIRIYKYGAVFFSPALHHLLKDVKKVSFLIEKEGKDFVSKIALVLNPPSGLPSWSISARKRPPKSKQTFATAIAERIGTGTFLFKESLFKEIETADGYKRTVKILLFERVVEG